MTTPQIDATARELRAAVDVPPELHDALTAQLQRRIHDLERQERAVVRDRFINTGRTEVGGKTARGDSY